MDKQILNKELFFSTPDPALTDVREIAAKLAEESNAGCGWLCETGHGNVIVINEKFIKQWLDNELAQNMRRTADAPVNLLINLCGGEQSADKPWFYYKDILGATNIFHILIAKQLIEQGGIDIKAIKQITDSITVKIKGK